MPFYKLKKIGHEIHTKMKRTDDWCRNAFLSRSGCILRQRTVAGAVTNGRRAVSKRSGKSAVM